MKPNSTFRLMTVLGLLFLAGACGPASQHDSAPVVDADKSAAAKEETYVEKQLKNYETVRLTTDMSALSDAEKQMIPLLIRAAQQMDDIFWHEAFGDRQVLMDTIQDEATRKFITLNYGPWDRLNANHPFVEGAHAKSQGANFYPQDMTPQEFELAEVADKKALYTLIHWQDETLESVPYHAAFQHEVSQASEYLKQAAALAEDPGLKKYLELRAEALINDDYKASDIAWLDMKDNTLDVIIGPIETYEDQLFGYKAAHEAYILVKDKAWSERLERYVGLLPDLQRGLPVDDQYKTEKPGIDSELNAYDVIYYAGDCNAGSKTIAINLPNDEDIQKNKGTRRLQLKNTMRAKFDKILVPLADLLIAEDQRQYITFAAFFENTMFHEVAHGLGVKITINGNGTVRQALRDKASAMEEGKADVLGLYMLTQLYERGEMDEESGSIEDHYVTFLASIFRSVRFGASSAHGKANMLRFNYFKEKGAFSRDDITGTYRVDFDKMQQAVTDLSRLILTLQGDGDYDGVEALMDKNGQMGLSLQADLARLIDAGVPIDLIFEQGTEVLGLEPAPEVAL